MSFFNNVSDIKLLKNLLCPKDADDDSDTDIEDEIHQTKGDKINTGSLVKKSAKKADKKSPYDPLPPKIEKQPQSIEAWQAMQEKEDTQLLEKRQQPHYNISYRQAIGTEDVFLQLGNRTGATASCEDMLLEILLPGDTTPVDKMGLNMTETEMELSTNMYYLKMPLCQNVDVDRCSARFIKAESKMVLTLRLVRELDFVNF